MRDGRDEAVPTAAGPRVRTGMPAGDRAARPRPAGMVLRDAGDDPGRAADDGLATLRRTARNPAARWPGPDDPRRAADGLVCPAVTPGFAIPEGGPILTLGDGAARALDRPLAALGHGMTAGGDAAGACRPPDFASPGVLAQAVAGGVAPDAGLIPVGDGMVIDPVLATGGRAVPARQAMARRAEVTRDLAAALDRAAAVVVSVGTTETWVDRAQGLWLAGPPPRAALRADPDRYALRVLAADDCAGLLAEVLDRITARAGRGAILMVSPLPAPVTHGGGCAVTADALAKATLRLAADAAAGATPGADYFPAHEMAASLGPAAFTGGGRRLSPAVAARIARYLHRAYRAAASVPAPAPARREAPAPGAA